MKITKVGNEKWPADTLIETEAPVGTGKMRWASAGTGGWMTCMFLTGKNQTFTQRKTP